MKKFLLISGSFCAYIMGASFSSGREMLQYFSGYGIAGYCGLAFTSITFVLFGFIVMKTASKENFEDPYDVFPYFCGQRFGNLFIWLLTFLLAADVVMMTSSAGANLTETLGLSGNIGRCTCLLAAATVCLGLNKIIDIISKLGPAVAVSMAILAVIATVKAPSSVSEGSAAIAGLDIFTGNKNIFESAVRYSMYCNLANIPILVICGEKLSGKKEVILGATTQVLAWGSVCILAITSQIINIESIYMYQIPNIMLVKMYLPKLKLIFSLILLICTYSSTTVMLWTVVRKFAKEKSPFYYILTISLGIAAYILSGTMPFSGILALVFNYGFYPGIVFFVIVIVSGLKEKKIT